jgi:hypothetical protein
MMNQTIICCAYPFGYGPAAKLLHIARGLKSRGARLVFLGTGIAHELVARANLFDEVANTGPDDQHSRVLIRDGACLLSVMDRDYAGLAVEGGRPLFVVDSLLWMRDRVPAVFQHARRYWAQSFADDRRRLRKVGPNANVVGPILGPDPSVSPARGTRAVINLGGGEMPDGLGESQFAYCDFVLRAVSAALSEQRRGAVLLGGKKCIAYLRDRYPDCGLEMVSANHEDALALLRTARYVLTSPGLTTALECFQARTPTYFLPPQNYSQWWILKKLRERGLAPGSFHWEDVLPDSPIVEKMPEERRGPLVRDAIYPAIKDRRAEQLLKERLIAALAGDPNELAGRQRAFFDSLGPVGTGQIVNEVLASVARRSPQPARMPC